MNDEFLKRAQGCRFFQGALLELAASLPVEDDALDGLVAEAVARRENEAFVRIVFAALGSGRRVDARHLEIGASLFDEPRQLAAAAMHMAGDVPRALIAAVDRRLMGSERQAAALFLAGVWCKEKGNGVVPPELIAHARIQARRAGLNPLVDLQLTALAELLNDQALLTVLRSRVAAEDPRSFAKDVMSKFVDDVRESPLNAVPERPGPIVQSGYTVRRAVDRIGRNDPCPCGSGKKYKKCCIEKDQERLHESSSVPGLTREEFKDMRELFLTQDELQEMRSYELVRLDPVKVSESLRPLLINCLLQFGELESTVALFEKIGVPNHLFGHWNDCVQNVVRNQRKDLLLRLLKLRNGSASPTEELSFAARLLLTDHADVLPMIEQMAIRALKDPDGEAAMELVYALLEGQWPGLGILVGHGLVASRPIFEADILFHTILETRDKLNLPPDDPLQTVLDQRYKRSIEEHPDSDALRKAHERLDSKDRELREARSHLAQTRTELERKEREIERRKKATPLPAPAPAPPQSSPNDTAVDELRRRMESLKQELKQRHNERNELRHELKIALEHLETLRHKEAPDAEPDAAEQIEQSLLETAETNGVQPVRTPEFSKKFLESFEHVPTTAVRHAMTLIGRLSAGESGAFTGAKRLKANRQIIRQRVGADFRLLFRLHPKTIELLALIPRRDLERTIRNLPAG